MKFHSPSFVIGVGVTMVVMATRTRLRPVVVEIGALGAHLARLGRTLVERQIEHVEDVWAEIDERVRARERRARTRTRGDGAAAAAHG